MLYFEFKVGQKAVHAAHGVGEVVAVESEAIVGVQTKFYVVSFPKDKMTIRIPVNRSNKSGLRSLSSANDIEKVRSTLKSRAKVSRGMWSRRAKEYESKINSGNILSLAEVVRDLHKNVDDPDRSYSERLIYENALNRLAGELAAIENIDTDKATNRLVTTMNNALKIKGAAA